jgi:hypothetical protein
VRCSLPNVVKVFKREMDEMGGENKAQQIDNRKGRTLLEGYAHRWGIICKWVSFGFIWLL